MISFMPQIYPDELFYSWVCRYYIHSGSFTHKSVRNDFFCKKSDNISKEFIGNLNSQAKEILSTMYSMEELILNHTMFPQYARFLSAERKKEALYHLQYDYRDIHSLFPVLLRDSSDKQLKYCPMCSIEDKNKYGETYWHRLHQMRGIDICIKHKCKLLSSFVPIKSEQSYSFYPAENIVKETKINKSINPNELMYCKYLADVFYAPFNTKEDSFANNLIYESLTKTKYMNSTGSMLRTKLLSDDLKSFYTKKGISHIISFSQIQRTLLGNRSDFSSVCQLAYFMGISANNLTDINISNSLWKLNKKSPQRHPVDWNKTDDIFAPRLQKLAYEIYCGNRNELGRPDIVSECKVYKLLALPSHSLEKMPKCKSILKSYSEVYEELWARRIIWAYDKLKENNIQDIFWTDIRTLSGVKRVNIDSVIPHLRKHASPMTFNSIVSILKKQSAHNAH